MRSFSQDIAYTLFAEMLSLNAYQERSWSKPRSRQGAGEFVYSTKDLLRQMLPEVLKTFSRYEGSQSLIDDHRSITVTSINSLDNPIH